jgi:cholesterol transport system auxiliary component
MTMNDRPNPGATVATVNGRQTLKGKNSALPTLCCLLVGAAVLAGCAFQPTLPAPKVYDLGLAQPSPSAAPKPKPTAAGLATVRLFDVAGAEWLQGNDISYRLAYINPYQRQAYRDSRWAAPPAALLGERLRWRLAQAGCGAGAGPGQAQATLQLNLDEFDQVFSSASRSQVQLRLRAVLLLADGAMDSNAPDALSSAPLERVFEVERDSPSADAEGAVEALAGATDQAIDDVLRWIAVAAPGSGCRKPVSAGQIKVD